MGINRDLLKKMRSAPEASVQSREFERRVYNRIRQVILKEIRRGPDLKEEYPALFTAVLLQVIINLDGMAPRMTRGLWRVLFGRASNIL